MKAVKISDVNINSGFWKEYSDLVRDLVLPYQWEVLNDNIEGVEPSHAVANMKIAANLEKGDFQGFIFQDSDLGKWLEGVGYSLAKFPDEKLMEKADKVIDIMELAQQEDGYLFTYHIINGIEKRFTNLLDQHELYCLGHLLEGAISYYEGTGKKKMLDIMCRYVDLVDKLFGKEEGKLKGYPGHQELEIALIKLYDLTNEKRYLNLAKYFIDERGKEPHYFLEEWEKRGRVNHWNPHDRGKPNFAYYQAHLPVREQKVAVGHAVRAVYMYTAMADLANKTNDSELLKACETIWNNIANKQLYITGGIGQTMRGEAFTFDYDLPNETVYSETCAAIGLVFFAHKMLMGKANSWYADILENALYNTVIAGMSKDGEHFFYVNPLEVWPEASEKNPDRKHVLPQRPTWYPCACCPPNVVRLITSLGKYIYASDEDNIFIHLYISSDGVFEFNNNEIRLNMETNYPYDGKVEIKVNSNCQTNKNIALRLPDWCKNPVVKLNGENIGLNNISDGYLYISKVWVDSDLISIDFPMEIQLIKSNTHVRANAGKVAVKRGPLVYCMEEIDNCNNLSSLSIYSEGKHMCNFEEDILGGTVVITASGEKDIDENNNLYYEYNEKTEKVHIKFIPYHLWGNRGVGEMQVWVRNKN